jgi:acyl-CoA thioester hydrolase
MIRRQTTVRVRYRDTDQMGVVYHGVYLEFFETGRTELLREIGMAYSSIERSGFMLPVLEATMKLHRPARYDDLLTVISTISDPITARLKIHYEIRNGDRILITGHTVHAFTTVDGMRPVRPPRDFLALIESASEAGA